MTDARYYHAEHCDVNIDVALEVPEGGTFTEEPPATIDSVCMACGSKLTAVQITRWERERYTAVEDDCKNCGEAIVFLPDMLAWYHVEDDRSIVEVDYGLLTCEAVMVGLLGMPAASLPEYAGMVAEPTNTHVTVDLVPQCERHGGKWGDDATCEACTDEDGDPLPPPAMQVETAEELAEKVRQKAAKKEQNKSKIGELSPSFLRSLGGK